MISIKTIWLFGLKRQTSSFSFEQDFRKLHITYFQISNIECHNEEGEEDSAKQILISFDFLYDGNSDLQVNILGMNCGVRDLKISGRGRIILKPTTREIPFVGGLQFCFMDIPQIDFDLDGIANLLGTIKDFGVLYICT